jgi:hypothetical protein
MTSARVYAGGHSTGTPCANGRQTLTPPAVARRLGCGVGKILGWIARRELTAINIASRPGMRPRWVIRLADLEAFEQRRANTVRPPRRRRKGEEKRPAGCIEFF